MAATHVTYRYCPPMITWILFMIIPPSSGSEEIQYSFSRLMNPLYYFSSWVLKFPSYHWWSSLLSLGIALSLVVLLWVRTKRKSSSASQRLLSRRGSEADFEILRNTRERSTTFDFFGISQQFSRERSRSNDSFDLGLVRGERSNSIGGGLLHNSSEDLFRRERMGSMDLFYAAPRGSSTRQLTSTTRNPELPSSTKNNAKTTALNNEFGSQAFFQSQLANATGGGGDEEGYLYDEFGLVTLSFEVVYYGPSITALKYSTWTPPTSWAEASRRIIPQDIMLKLQRNLMLDVRQSKIVVQEPKSSGQWDFDLPVHDISMHVTPPVECGVLHLYVKGSPKDEWMEHTFESAHDSAQFQLDLLAYQVVGKTLHHMFEVLSLVHLGSLAYEGQEYVLHDDGAPVHEGETDNNEESKNNNTNDDSAEDHRVSSGGCVAWDDAMRALSSIPTIRIALERLWLSYRRPSASNNLDFGRKNKKGSASDEAKASEGGFLSEQYSEKRLLLGPVDFFRLFVPALPETAVPQSESTRSRMEQLLSWRKRAARAAVLVRAYTMSHRVVNLGWELWYPVQENEESMTKRLAFDSNDDNNRRDIGALNEYYEAFVSRDVLCHVRPFDYFTNTGNTEDGKGDWDFFKRRLVLSPYQAYSLVGVHVFKIPPEEEDHPLHPSRDPVEAFPSLRKLLAENPDLDFFIFSFFSRNSVSIFCYVRSLPKGIDPQFDNVMERFTNGKKDVRDQKVHMMLQLGPSLGLSFAGRTVLRILSLFFSLTKKGRESPLALEATNDRKPFPAIRLASYSETYHFGGALSIEPDMPANYVSMSSVFQPQHMPNLVSRLLFSRIEGQMAERVLDFTFVLEGQAEDELPERALCTSRMVHVDNQAVGKAASFNVTPQETKAEEMTEETTTHGSFGNRLRQSIYDVAAIVGLSNIDKRPSVTSGDQDNLEQHPGGNVDASDGGKVLDSSDPLEVATNEITEILKGVEIPVKSNILSLEHGAEEMIQLPVLKIVSRHDIKRFVRASDFDVKKTSVRIVQTAAWRGRMFPVDVRKCRIELQNGQFFQQGFDRQHNPVYYFRNVCLGPWRKDVDAVVSAVVFRLDKSLQEFCKSNPNTKCTLIILMGQPILSKHSDDAPDEEATKDESDEAAKDDDGDTEGNGEDRDGEEPHPDAGTLVDPDSMPNNAFNPRISLGEHWHKHSSRELIEVLIEMFSAHYPERLEKALVVRGKGKNHYFRTVVKGRLAMKKLLCSQEMRNKVKFVKNPSELTEYVEESQLVSIVGGSVPIEPGAFQFR